MWAQRPTLKTRREALSFLRRLDSPSQMPQETHNPFSWHLGILEKERNRNLRRHHEPVTVVQWLSCVWLCNPTDCSAPRFPVLHCFPEFAQARVRGLGAAIQPSHPLSPPSPPALSLSQHQGLFQWVSSSHQVAKVLELQHQSFQWIFRTDFL